MSRSSLQAPYINKDYWLQYAALEMGYDSAFTHIKKRGVIMEEPGIRRKIYSKEVYAKSVQELLREYKVGKDDPISIVHTSVPSSLGCSLVLVTFMGIKPEEDD